MNIKAGVFNAGASTAMNMDIALAGRAKGALEAEMGRGKKSERLGKAVSAFDALFVNNMLKAMRGTIPKSSLFGKGMGEDIYTSLFDWEISKEMASRGGLGLGSLLLDDFKGPGLHGRVTNGARDGPIEKKYKDMGKNPKVILDHSR